MPLDPSLGEVGENTIPPEFIRRFLQTASQAQGAVDAPVSTPGTAAPTTPVPVPNGASVAPQNGGTSSRPNVSGTESNTMDTLYPNRPGYGDAIARFGLAMIPLVGPHLAQMARDRAEQEFTQQHESNVAMARAIGEAIDNGNLALLNSPDIQKFGKAWFKTTWNGLMSSAKYNAVRSSNAYAGAGIENPAVGPSGELVPPPIQNTRPGGMSGVSALPSGGVGLPQSAAPALPVGASTAPSVPAVPAPAGSSATAIGDRSAIVDQLVAIGQSVKGPKEGASFTTRVDNKTSISLSGITPDQRARAIIAHASKIQAPLSAVFDALNRSGVPIPENMIQSFANQQAMKTYSAAKTRLADEQGLTGQALERAAARAQLAQDGYASPKLEKLYWTDDKEAERDARARVIERTQTGTIVQAIREAKASRFPLSKDDEVGLLKDSYNETKSTLMANGMAEDDAIKVAGASVNNDARAIPPQEFQFAREVSQAGKKEFATTTAKQAAEAGQPLPDAERGATPPTGARPMAGTAPTSGISTEGKGRALTEPELRAYGLPAGATIGDAAAKNLVPLSPEVRSGLKLVEDIRGDIKQLEDLSKKIHTGGAITSTLKGAYRGTAPENLQNSDVALYSRLSQGLAPKFGRAVELLTGRISNQQIQFAGHLVPGLSTRKDIAAGLFKQLNQLVDRQESMAYESAQKQVKQGDKPALRSDESVGKPTTSAGSVTARTTERTPTGGVRLTPEHQLYRDAAEEVLRTTPALQQNPRYQGPTGMRQFLLDASNSDELAGKIGTLVEMRQRAQTPR